GRDFDGTPALALRLRERGVEMSDLRRPTGFRGVFSTGPVLAGALFGPNGDQPAKTMGQVWARLPISQNSGARKKLRATAEFYGFTLPGERKRQGAPAGESPMDDDQLFLAAYAVSTTNSAMCEKLGLSASGKT